MPIVSETKPRPNPNSNLVPVKKKAERYFDEIRRKFSLRSKALKGCKFMRNGDETEIE